MLADYDYRLVDLDKDELESFILAKNYDGLNVTIPYKTDVIKYLDDEKQISNQIDNKIVNQGGIDNNQNNENRQE